ncbi:MAG: Fic family protein [Lachnospiraceae bacterium]|nr:Fic family protein [Lachnospiraceae bacterium]
MRQVYWELKYIRDRQAGDAGYGPQFKISKTGFTETLRQKQDGVNLRLIGLEELLEEVKEEEGKDVMAIAAYFHLRFEEIHPFADGNGRLGRTLLNYYLMTHDYPPLVLFEEDKKTYYMALTVFDKTGEIDGFLARIRSIPASLDAVDAGG